MLYYPQSGERIRGRHNIQESRTVQPNKKRFTVQRMIGSGDFWVTDSYLAMTASRPTRSALWNSVTGWWPSETQYFADRFDPAPSRAHLVERIGDEHFNPEYPGDL